MASKSELLALAERVEAGTGRDVPLHSDIANAVWPAPDTGHFLTSVDAVEALRERLLPEMWICITAPTSAVGKWDSCIGPPELHSEDMWYGLAKDEPRCRLAALLRAYAGGMQG